MSVEDCLAHKWLADESPERPLALESAAVNDVGLDLHVAGEAEEEEEETTARNAVQQLTQEVEIKEEASMRSDEDDDDQSEECASNSDKENSLVFNTVRSINSSNNTTSMSSSNSSHDSSDIIFPDAPTTPKVLRKAPPDTSPGVKALVKKFQVDAVKQQMSNSNEANSCQSTMLTSSPVSAAGALQQQQQSACFVSQIPKLVNSPKSAYSNGSSRRNSLSKFSPRSESPAKSIAALRSATGENRKSAGTTATLASLSAGSSTPSSPASTEPLKSPNSRYVMACVVCGEFNCRHQTTTVARKSILGMEQRITC